MRTIPLVVVVLAFSVTACEQSTVGPSAASRGLATEGEVMLGTVEGLTLSSAVVASGFNCTVGVFGGYPRVSTNSSHATESNSGKMTLTCHGQLPEGMAPEKAEIQRSEDFPGRRCRVFSSIATRWRQVFTPSGEISLTCQVK